MMKKRLTLTCVLVFALFLSSFGQKGFKNPAAIYAEAMGYGTKTKLDANGNQFGVTVLPSGKEVNSWDLYKGKVEPQYSYCAKKGYLVKTTTTTQAGYQTECAVCYSGSNLKAGEEIPMIDLMKKNGDLPAQEEKNQEVQAISNAQIDPYFKAAQALPTSFDWRSYNGHSYIGAVKNQGNCGDCYAFGAVACAEGVYNFATGNYDSNCADFSEGYISFCLGSMSAYSSHFSGCNGADYTYSELQALVDIGVCNESYFPYSDATSQSCPSAATNAPKTKFLNWFRPPCSDIASIKTAIMTYGIVDAAVYVDAAFQNYSGGIFSNTSTACTGSPCDYTPTNHAIALVGWGYDATVGDYWILRNSWGSAWGESGYMRVAATAARVACSVAYLTYSADTTVPVTGVSLNTTTLALTTGQTSTLVATIAPTNATNQSVSWASGNTSVATVSSSGVVTAVAIGSATITVTTADGSKTATCAVTVTTPTATYCTSKGNSVTDEWINRVVLNTIDKTSGANSGYADFTATSTSLAIGGTYTITIYPSWSGSTYNEGYAVWIDLNNDKDFADTGELLFSNAATSSTSVSGSLTIPSGTSASSTRMRISMKYNAIPTSCETFSYGEVEDYTVNIVTGTVSCGTPSVASASAVTSAGAVISWAAVSGASSYDVHYRVTGTTTWTSVNTTSTSVTLSGLSASTVYDYEVRTVCSSGNSAYSATQSFTTLSTTVTYCTSKGSSSTYEWISGVAIGTFSNTSGAAGYTDFTSKTISLVQSTGYSITLTPGFSSSTYTEYWKIWVDFNKDGDFADSGEELFASAGSKTAVSGTITIPSTATGSTRLRVSMKYDATPTSCETFSYGEVEDYTIAFAAKTSAPGEPKEIVLPSNASTTEGLEVYPTIVENQLYFKATNLGSISSIKIYNYLGELAEDAPLNKHENSVNVSSLKNGVYILCIKTEKGIYKTKFIKN